MGSLEALLRDCQLPKVNVAAALSRATPPWSSGPVEVVRETKTELEKAQTR